MSPSVVRIALNNGVVQQLDLRSRAGCSQGARSYRPGVLSGRPRLDHLGVTGTIPGRARTFGIIGGLSVTRRSGQQCRCRSVVGFDECWLAVASLIFEWAARSSRCLAFHHPVRGTLTFCVPYDVVYTSRSRPRYETALRQSAHVSLGRSSAVGGEWRNDDHWIVTKPHDHGSGRWPP